MKARNFFITITLLFASLCITAQSVQYGYTEEYKGANEKKPLSGVNIMAGGATTKSDKTGKFRLDFTTLKVGDKVDADLRTVANLKGYVLFNKEAVEQWTVSGKSVYFRIVLCKQKDFDAMVKNYYNVSDKAYKEKLQKERDRAEQLKKDGEIQQQEYERLLKEAENRYNQAFKNLKENAELVARIDESELEGNQPQILQLAKEGRLDEAVELIRNSNTDQLLDDVTKKNTYIDEQIALYEQKKEETKAELSKLIARLKNEIKILKLAGGKESFDLCGEKWTKIAEADTTDLDNQVNAAFFFLNQNFYEKAEHYFHIAERGYAEKMKTDPDGNGLAYVDVLNRIAFIYKIFNKDGKYEYYRNSLKTVKELAAKNPDKYNRLYAITLRNTSSYFYRIKGFDQKLEDYTEALNIQKALMEKNPDNSFKYDYLTTLNYIAKLYQDENNYAEAENYYLQALAICKELIGKDPETYTDTYAYELSDLGGLAKRNKQYDKALEYFSQEEQIFRQLAEKNPDRYSRLHAIAFCNIGNVYSMKRLYDKEEEYYAKALSIIKSQQGLNRLFTDDYANVLHRISVAAFNNKHYAESEKYAQEALSIDHSAYIWEGSMLCGLKSDLLFALLFQGKYEEAEKTAGEMLVDAQERLWAFDGILDDLKEYEVKGIVPEKYRADVERMRIFFLKNNMSSIPADSIPADIPYLCFTARKGSMSLRFDIKKVTHTIQYSTDGVNWSTYIPNTLFYLCKDRRIFFRAEKNQTVASAFGDSAMVDGSHFYFHTTIDGNVECSGNIMSLYGPDCPNLPLQPYAFANLFADTRVMTTAPQLPATTLAEYCYYNMFVACHSLTSAPALPASTLASHCYELMFALCSNLKTPPALPATTLANHCYNCMFLLSNAINTLPELPATTLAEGCYRLMFSGCVALNVSTEGPGREWKIPATTTAKDALERMFDQINGATSGTPEPNTIYYIQSAETK